MTSHEILKANVLDILFDNRNKTYGAYELRKQYNNRLGFALGMMLGAVLLAIFILNQSSDEKPIASNPFIDNTVKITEVEIEIPKPELPRRPPQAARPVAQTSHTQIEIVADDKVDKAVPDQTTLINTAISTQTIEGKLTDNPHQPTTNTTGSQRDAEAKTSEPQGSFTAIERAASFPGGQSAWVAFLSKYLRTPGELEAGEKKTVYVRFAVDVDGSISRFEIVQSGGAAFDNEVIRVLKKMPKWTPAFQNGHNVSVIFTQPVTFMAFEE